jgi:hypothetical protein
VKPLAGHREVWDELDEAIAYYELRQAGLGKRFREAVQDAFDKISRSPAAFSPTKGGHRKCLVEGFPYTVIYKERDADVWIAAVAHQKRRPGYWSHRTPDD